MRIAESVLLLDTHVWIWIAEGITGKLSSACLSSIRAAGSEGRLLVSPISIWEVANLDAKRRISLSADCREWVDLGIKGHGIQIAELAPEIAIDSTRLPDNFHGDPADRILVATARYRNAILVTADRAILKYSRALHVRTVDAFSESAWK